MADDTRDPLGLLARLGRRPMDGIDIVLGTTTRGLELAAPVTLSLSDRRRHVLLIGKTGVGKSTLLKAMMFSDLAAGRGFSLFDPHGDLAESVVDAVPAWRSEVIYLDPSDLAYSVGFNPLAQVLPDQRPLVAAHLLAAFSHIWNLSTATTPRVIRILNAALRLLLDTPGTTLLMLPRVFSDDAFRDLLISRCDDPIVRSFWLDEFTRFSERFAVEAVDPLLNKIGLLLSEPAIRHMVAQVRCTINVRAIMDEHRCLIINLSKGRLGETPSHLIGAFLITAFSQAAEGRATVPEDKRSDHILYVDEFQNFATDSFVRILSESRKYRLSLVLAHQNLAQLPDTLRHAAFGNCGSLIAFRLGADDAAHVGREMQIEASAFLDLPNYRARATLLENGAPSGALYLETRYPHAPEINRTAAVLARTRARHARPRAVIDAMIRAQLSAIDMGHS